MAGKRITPSQSPDVAQEIFNRGAELLKQGKWQDALDDFNEAIRLRPDIAVGYRFRAYAYVEGGNIPRAIADFDEAIRLKPDDAQTYFDRAQNLFRQKMYEEALADCKRGLEIDPARADLIGLRGRIHSEAGYSGRARNDFAQAITLDPQNAADYLVMRADLNISLDEREEALEDFNRALELKPDNVYALCRRAGPTGACSAGKKPWPTSRGPWNWNRPAAGRSTAAACSSPTWTATGTPSKSSAGPSRRTRSTPPPGNTGARASSSWAIPPGQWPT